MKSKTSLPPAAPAREFLCTIVDFDGTSMTAIPVAFDPKAVFGRVRAPVRVTLGKPSHTFRSTICSMGGSCWVPLRKSNREPAGVKVGDRVRVRVEFDDQPRVVKPPADLVKALRQSSALAAWKALSFTHQREHVEAIVDAKKAETRSRRIEKCVQMVLDHAAKRRT